MTDRVIQYVMNNKTNNTLITVIVDKLGVPDGLMNCLRLHQKPV